METALVKKEEMNFSLDDIKKYIAPGATDKELFIFMNTAKAYGLNPMKREVYFIKYGQSPGQTIVGYETYIKRAERTGKLDGWRVWMEKDDIGQKAIIEIKRKDFSDPFRWEVYRNEFDKGQANWKTMGTFMLKKVAISQGFRLAFPDELGGMPYIPEEMPTEKGGGISEDLSKTTIEITPQEENPLETKHYSLHPQEAMDVPESTGMDVLDEAVLIADLKRALSDMMKGFSKESKVEFFKFVMEGKPENVDTLQAFKDRFIEFKQAYLKSKEA
jgi:phage recombination protein Bet